MDKRLNGQLDWAIKKLNTAGFEEDQEMYYNIAHVVTEAQREIKTLTEERDKLEQKYIAFCNQFQYTTTY